MKDIKFRQDIINTQLKIAQLQALICAEEEKETGGGEPKPYKAPWLKNVGEVLRVGGRFASKKSAEVGQAVGEAAGKAGEQSVGDAAGKAGEAQKPKELTKEEREKRKQEAIDKAFAQLEEEINHPKGRGKEIRIEVDFSSGETNVSRDPKKKETPPIKEAGPMGVDIPKMWDEIKKDPRAGIEKAIVDVMAASHARAIKENAGWLSDNITGVLGQAMAKSEMLALKSEIATVKSTVQAMEKAVELKISQTTGDALAKVKDALDPAPLIAAANYGKDRIAAIKETVEEEKARKQKGLPPMSAEQQANLASYKFHQKRAADNYSWNPLARNNARFATEKVAAAKASMGKSPDTVDKLLHDIGMATDKTKQVAESFKKRISEITPENYKEKLQEFAADCNVKPKGDPMTEVAQFLHAGTAILSGVGGVLGPETAIALAAAPLAPALMGEIAGGMIASNAASLVGSGVAMAGGWGEDAEKFAGGAAYLYAAQLTLGGPVGRVGEKLASTAAQKGTQMAPEAKAAYSSAKSAIAKAAKSEPAKKVSAAMQEALRKLGLSPKLAELPPEQASKVIQKAYSSKVAKAEKAIMKGGMKSRKPKLGAKKGFAATPTPPAAPAPAQVEMGAHDLNQSFSYLMKAIGL